MDFINYIRNLDQSIFIFFHDLTGKSKFVDYLVIFFGEYLIYFIVLTFLYFIYTNWKRGNLENCYLYILAIGSGIITRLTIIPFIRYFYERPRPFLTLSLSHLLQNDSFSFPSGHTIFIFALGGATFFFNRKLSYFVFISGLLVGLARVAGGVHYPSDILGGIVFGVITGFVTYKIYHHFTQRSKAL